MVALFEWLSFVLSFKINWLIALPGDGAKTFSTLQMVHSVVDTSDYGGLMAFRAALAPVMSLTACAWDRVLALTITT